VNPPMGYLMVLDGLDGSGKSTQFDRLCAYLDARGTSYKSICFPDYGQPSSALVKMYLDGEFGSSPDAVNAYAASSFYAVDRYASYQKFWRADYESGRPILAARYVTSNAIHQMPKLPREEWDRYLGWLEEYEYGLLGLPRPDLVAFLDMPTAISQRLLLNRYGGDSGRRDIHERDVAYLEHCREAALYAARRLHWEVVPCHEGGEPLPPEAITARLTERMGGAV
jgi:dTMP kinase